LTGWQETLSPSTVGAYQGTLQKITRMRKGVHLIIGVMAFFVYAYLINGIHVITAGFFILGLFAVAASSAMPDILEAPTSSRHRRIFHSKRALKCTAIMFGITVAIELLSSLPTLSKALTFGFSCFALGYFFHLLADSTTRRGLPE
jgi:membrane-bound metal-dependent hydrolase YbcI (DUF457 family)